MFIFRSAFWLTAAFIVISPSAGVDMGASTSATGEQLAMEGTKAVAALLAPEYCASIECAIGRGVLATASQFSSEPAPALAQPIMVSTLQAPVPPTRPSWAY